MTGRPLKFEWMEALRGADLSHAEYRVLLNLSTYANSDLTNAYPSRATLCADSGVSGPTAKKALRRLVEKGWLVLTEQGGNQHWKGKANVYSLSIPKGVTQLPPSGVEGGNSFSEGGKSTPPEGGNSVTPHQKELPGDNTSGSEEGVSYVSDAGASARPLTDDPQEPEPDSSAPEPEPLGPDPALNPLPWIDDKLPGGFRLGERDTAKALLAEGKHYGDVLYAILGARNSRKRPTSKRYKRPEEGIA
ncbi:MAG: helix-turn-helix domain-containing protein [Rhodococcus sp.]|nr:helix-turn-helix domain-containing protein [Rhodococcus sp. (in: high G+C Gram-positive bacteria)]